MIEKTRIDYWISFSGIVHASSKGNTQSLMLLKKSQPKIVIKDVSFIIAYYSLFFWSQQFTQAEIYTSRKNNPWINVHIHLLLLLFYYSSCCCYDYNATFILLFVFSQDMLPLLVLQNYNFSQTQLIVNVLCNIPLFRIAYLCA